MNAVTATLADFRVRILLEPLLSIGDLHAPELLVTGKSVYGNPGTVPGLPDQA